MDYNSHNPEIVKTSKKSSKKKKLNFMELANELGLNEELVSNRVNEALNDRRNN
jgi:hypothetical protein